LYGVSTATGHIQVLAKTTSDNVAFSLANGRLVWTENHASTGRLRALSAG
jgi:hypothetical protein